MSTPERPAGIPSTARFDPDSSENFRWEEGELDEQGEKHGPYRSWADAGYLHSEFTYVHGKVEGPNRVYHPDGSLASVGDWRLGTCLDATFYRAEVDSPEPFPAEAGRHVASVRYCSRDGISNQVVRYFDRDGTEVCASGDPVPPRPAGVDADAGFFPAQGRWMVGSIKRATNRPVGTVKHWSPEGVLLKHDEHDDDGAQLSSRDYNEDGTPRREKEFAGGTLRRKVVFYVSGRPMRIEEFDADERETYTGSWDWDGQVEEERRAEWDGEMLIRLSHRDDHGLVCDVEREAAGLTCRVYHRGILRAEGTVAGGRVVGTWKIHDPAGGGIAEIDLSDHELETDFEERPDAPRLRRLLVEAVAQDLIPEVDPPELGGMGEVVWDEIEGCFGTADSFPLSLCAVASGDPWLREFGIQGIAGEIEHQGSIYPATGAVMPFLIRLLDNPTAFGAELLGLIRLAGGAAAACADEAAAEDEDEGDEEDEEQAWRRAIRDTLAALRAGMPRLFARFETASPREKQIILDLVGFVPGGEATRTQILDWTRSPDVTLRATAVHAGSRFDYLEPDDLIRFFDDPDPRVGAVAAVCTARRFGPASPAAALAPLRDAFEARETLRPAYAELPFVKADLLADLALAIGSIRSPEAFAMAPALCRVIDELDGVNAVAFGTGLLALAFGPRRRPFMPGFLEVLDALARSSSFYRFNVDASGQLRRFGINTGISPVDLAALVTRLRGESDPEAALHALMHSSDE